MKKPNWLKNIKVLVWDLDGTLYQENPAAKIEVDKNAAQLIAKTKLLSFAQAEKLYKKNYQKLKSSTKVLLELGLEKKLIMRGDWYSETQLKYLKKDHLLANIFPRIKRVRHILNTNSVRQPTIKKINILGLESAYFDKIYSASEMEGDLKPNIRSFKEIIQFTKLPAGDHLSIGNSVAKDIIPAKKVGMKTCLVWGKSSLADLSLPTVYDVVELFI